MNRLKTVDMIYIKRSRYKLNVTIGIIIVLLALAFGASFGVYYKQYQQLFRIYTELFTKYTSLSKGPVCENADPYPTYKIITKIPKQLISQSVEQTQIQSLNTGQSLNAGQQLNATSNTYLQRLQAEGQVEEQEFEYFTKILQIKPILKDLVLENLLIGSNNTGDSDTGDSDDTSNSDTNNSNDPNHYQEMFKKYGQMSSIEQIDSSKIEPEEIDNVLVITSAGSLEYTNFNNYHIQEEQLLENLDAVGLKHNSKIDIPKDVKVKHQKGCGIPYSPTPQSILIDNDVYLPIHITGNVKTEDKLNTAMNTIYQSNYKGDIVVEGIAGNIVVQKGVSGNITVLEGGVSGNITVLEGGVSGNIIVQQGGVGGRIYITGNVGENITATDQSQDDTTTIYIEGNVLADNGKGISVKSITAKEHALYVNGDITSTENGLGILINGSIKAKTYTLSRTIQDQTQTVEPNKNNNPLMYNPIGTVFINGTITQEQPTNIKYTYNWNYADNTYNSVSTITTDPTIHSIVVNNTNTSENVLNGGIFISKGTIKTNSPNTAFTADKIVSSGKHAIDVQYASIDAFTETDAISGENSDKASVVQIGKVETTNNSNATGIRCGSVNTPSGRGIWIYKTNANTNANTNTAETGEIISGESNIHIEGDIKVDSVTGTTINPDSSIIIKGSITNLKSSAINIQEGGIESHGSEAIKIGGDVINHGSKGIIINGKVQAQSNHVLYVKNDVEQLVKEESTVIQIDGNVQATGSSQPDNKIIYIGGTVGTTQPTHSVFGAGIGVYIGGDVKCRNSGVIIEGGIEAYGFRGDQPENDPNYGFKAKYIDVGYNWTENPNNEVVQGPYGIHVGWINSFNTSINITNEDHTQTINTTDENGTVKEETITLPAIRTNYTAINIGGDIEGYGRHIELTDKQKNDISQPGIYYDSEEYKQKLNEIKQSFEYVLVSIDGDIKADIATSNDVNYTITYSDQSTAIKKETFYHSPKLLLSTKGLYGSMSHSRTDGIQINGHIEAANGITVVGNITTSLTTGGGTSFDDSFVDTVKAYVKIKGSLYQHDKTKRGPNGIVVGGVIRAKSSNGFYIANSNKAVDKDNTIEAGQCISVNDGNLVASTTSSTSISQHVVQIWSGDIIVEESVPPSEGEEPEIKTHTIPAGTYTTQQIIDKLIDFTAPIGININGNIQNLRNGLGFRIVGDITAQTDGVYISGTVKTDYQDAKLDKGVSYSAIYAGNIKSNWNGITVGNIEAEKIGIAVKGTVKQTGTHERCYYDCLEVDTNPDASNIHKINCKTCRDQTNYKNMIDDIPAAISVQSIQSTGIGYGIHVFESIKTNNDSIKVSGLNQPICDNSEKLNTSICSNNANGIIINGTIETLSTSNSAINISGSLNKIKQESEETIQEGVTYIKETYNVINNAIRGNVGLSINGTINSSNIGIKLENGANGLQTVWKKKLNDGKTLQTLNDTSVLSSILIQSQNQGMNLTGEINTLNEGIVLNPSNITTITNTYTNDNLDDNQTITNTTNQRTITSGLTAIQVNGDLNSTGATTVNITGTVYNDYYLLQNQECYKDGKITSTEDDGLTNITAVYIKWINTLENKEYYNEELPMIGVGGLGTCYKKSKGAYGLIVDGIQSFNGSVMLSKNITSIGEQAIRVGYNSYVYGRFGALQVDTCATLRANEKWSPLSISYVSFVNENIDDDEKAYSVQLNNIYISHKNYFYDLSKSTFNGICENNQV